MSTLCISQFRYSAQIRPSSVVTKDYTFKRPGWAGRLNRKASTRTTSARSMKCMTTRTFQERPRAELCPLADGRLAKQRRNRGGMSRSPEIWPGRRIVLTGIRRRT
ncbi:hypothetical protein ACVXG9_23465 [Escherichia coli]